MVLSEPFRVCRRFYSEDAVMPKRSVLLWTVLVAAGAVWFTGCGGADNPRIVSAPAFTPPSEPQPPPTLPGRKEAYGTNKKYEDAMERMNTR